MLHIVYTTQVLKILLFVKNKVLNLNSRKNYVKCEEFTHLLDPKRS